MEVSECQICLQSMVGKNPRALPCLHTFCESCLESLICERLQDTRCQYCNFFNGASTNGYCTHFNGGRNYDHTGFLSICCPTCRMEVKLQGGVHSLPLNFMINQMSELHLRNFQICQRCKTANASFACETCIKPLCGKCKDRHDTVPAFSSHSVRPLDCAARCSKHREESLYVCIPCGDRICAECILSDYHQSHEDQVVEYKTWIEAEKMTLVSIQSELKPKLLTLQSELQDTKRYRKHIDKTLSEVNNMANQMKQTIDRNRNVMANTLTLEHKRVDDIIGKMEKMSADATKFCSVKEENLSATSIVQEMAKLKRKGEAVQQSAAQIPSVEKSWFVFEPETLKTFGSLLKTSWAKKD